MTLDEAREAVGAGVVYRAFNGSPVEQGEITSVNERFVFVRYGSDFGSKATDADRLELLAPR